MFIVIVVCFLLMGIGGGGCGRDGHATIVDPDQLKESRIKALQAKQKK